MARPSSLTVLSSHENGTETVQVEVSRSLEIEGIGSKDASETLEYVRVQESCDAAQAFQAMLSIAANRAKKINAKKEDGKKEVKDLGLVISYFNDGLTADLKTEVSGKIMSAASKALRGLKKVLSGMKAMNPSLSQKELAALVLSMGGIREKLQAEGVTLSDAIEEPVETVVTA